jgi:hypothetical protein
MAYKYRTTKHTSNKDKVTLLAALEILVNNVTVMTYDPNLCTQQSDKNFSGVQDEPVQCSIVKINVFNNCVPTITQLCRYLPHIINKIFMLDTEKSSHLKYVTDKAVVRHLSQNSPISCTYSAILFILHLYQQYCP